MIDGIVVVDSGQVIETNESAIIAKDEADRAEKWAKYSEEQAKTVTAGTLNESILTNCLTEIPQDIKLELNNGKLTLKAGSKVYNIDGTSINITSDKTYPTTKIGSWFLVVEGNGISRGIIGNAYTGDTAPNSPDVAQLWYDTAKKQIKRYNGSIWANVSLPVAVFTYEDNQVKSIDRVFNGFGYIGSTIFVLPGVEGLIPTGRNTDGSLNNLKYTINNLLTVQAGTTSNGYFGIVNGSLLRRYPPNAVYDEAKNIWYNPETGNSFQFLYCGNFSEVSSRITSLTPNTAFHAVDYNEFTRALKTQFNNLPKHEVVSVLPVEPDPNVIYLIPEE